MSQHKISTVTVNAGVDIDLFHDQMINSLDGVDGVVHLPQHPVEVHDEMLLSNRNTQYYLTEEECEELKKDPRVMDVMWGTIEENGFISGTRGFYEDSQARSHHKTNSAVGDPFEVNWGMAASNSRTDPFIESATYNFLSKTAYTGKGIDVVIQDSGVDESHPEFFEPTSSTSRITRVNWSQYLSPSSTLPTTYYTSLTDGHGTHVASTAAGRTCGWAREATVISQRLYIGSDTGGILSPLQGFQTLRAWHNAKTNGKPTIVNMSWGYYQYYPITPDPAQGQVGLVHGARISSIDAEVSACIADGIIFVGSAGNDSHKVDVVGGVDYNKNYVYNGSTYYYLRGSSPCATPGVIHVGAGDAVLGDKKATYSCAGPRVDVYAPGSGIVAAWPNGLGAPIGYYKFTYQADNTKSLVRLSGTSMASPQVTGVLACYLESNPGATPAEARNWIQSVSTKSRMTDTGGSYSDFTSLQNVSGNRYLYNGNYPFVVLRNFNPTGFTIANMPAMTP